MVTSISRRDMLFTLGAGVIAVRGETATAVEANKPLRGALLILHTGKEGCTRTAEVVRGLRVDGQREPDPRQLCNSELKTM